MIFHKTRRNAGRGNRKSAFPLSQGSSGAVFVEPLECRRLLTVNGYVLVDEAHPPAAGVVIDSKPTAFQDGVENMWHSLADGTAKINGQSLSQEITASINAAEQKQGLKASGISSSFAGNPIYTGVLHPTSTGANLVLNIEGFGNQIHFTSTDKITGLHPPPDPQFSVSYNLNVTITIALSSNVVTGTIGATINAAASNVTVTQKNPVTGLATELGVANLPAGVAALIDGLQSKISAVVPTTVVDKTLGLQLPQGYRTLLIGLNSSGNLLLTALKIYTATPVIAPAAGTYFGSASVKITDGTPGAAIRYTTNGSTPTSSSTLYSGPVDVTKSETIKAVAIATDYATGDIASATYTIIPPGAVAGSQATAASSYNLTTLGTTDWVDFGKTVNHKAGATQIGGLTEIKAKGSFFTGVDSAHSVSWTNGSPTAAASGDDSLIYATGESAGYSFVVPALKTTQTLYILAGGIGGGVHLTAHLSDGSAPDYTTSAKPVGTGVFADLFKITFKAGTSGATLAITLDNALNTGRTDLIAAALA